MVDVLEVVPPFEGTCAVVGVGPNFADNHHLQASDQRFACDLVFIDGESLGRPVLSPASGRIVRVVDRYDDTPKPLWRWFASNDDVFGNHVVIEVGKRYVFLCHLQQGSTCVREGDEVIAGMMLGRCGNSGRSSEPHIHLQAQDRPLPAINRARAVPLAFIEANGGRTHLMQRTTLVGSPGLHQA